MTLARAKPERIRSRAHLDFIKQLQCVACACEGRVTHGCDPAHVSFLQPRGIGQKTSDANAVPLCRTHHDEQHATNERLWWARLGVDVRGLAGELYATEGDLVEGETIVGAYAQARRRVHRLRPAGELLEPVTLTRPVLVEAHVTDGCDENGNVEVLIARLGARGTPDLRVAVDPDAIRQPQATEADRGR